MSEDDVTAVKAGGYNDPRAIESARCAKHLDQLHRGPVEWNWSGGILVQVPMHWMLEAIEVHAMFPAGRAATPAARMFAEFLVAHMAGQPFFT